MDNINGFLSGIGVEKQTNSAASVIQALLAGETNPEVRRIISGLEPVPGQPGFYQNLDERLLIKYQPQTDTQPTIVSTNYSAPSTSKVIKE